MSLCEYMPHMCIPRKQKKVSYRKSCTYWHWWGDKNSGPLEEQKVIFSIKPPLQPQYFILYHGIVTEINFLFHIWDICC